MKIVVDDQAVETQDWSEAKTVADFIDALMERDIVAEDAIVGTLEIDGRKIDLVEDDLENVPFDASSVKNVVVTTDAVADLLSSAVADSRETCGKLAGELREAAAKFRGSKLADAADFYSGVAGRIMEVIGYLAELDGHLRSGLEGYDGGRFKKVRDRFQKALGEALKSQEEGDWVLLADLLEYEFAEVFDDFADHFAAVSENLN
ncbi:MAG: hypothetical protein M5R36_13350 [Deltaproteobacteria bacterium]|nr:hypothetical protein [Deltaproteobacteria bacterium]